MAWGRGLGCGGEGWEAGFWGENSESLWGSCDYHNDYHVTIITF